MEFIDKDNKPIRHLQCTFHHLANGIKINPERLWFNPESKSNYAWEKKYEKQIFKLKGICPKCNRIWIYYVRKMLAGKNKGRFKIYNSSYEPPKTPYSEHIFGKKYAGVVEITNFLNYQNAMGTINVFKKDSFVGKGVLVDFPTIPAPQKKPEVQSEQIKPIPTASEYHEQFSQIIHTAKLLIYRMALDMKTLEEENKELKKNLQKR